MSRIHTRAGRRERKREQERELLSVCRLYLKSDGAAAQCLKTEPEKLMTYCCIKKGI